MGNTTPTLARVLRAPPALVLLVSKHLWFHEYSDEDVRPGDVMIYWLKVKANNIWLRSVEHRYIIGGVVPTALNHQPRTPTTKTSAVPSTSRVTPRPPRTRPPATTTTLRPVDDLLSGITRE
ncbi:hypothetical protein EB796_003773 [Bugula neritina]|uniref:Uncharacterized protein n=1 Tax=Bugula neritina TaxID=10212 RepID=A0A7J7KJ63_BUGNE|nr:hypothetical protein EB796_003773 [Bugula neritina]